MTLSLILACLWAVAANLIALVPSKRAHWPQAYVLIAIGIGYVVWRFSIYFVRILSMTPEEIDPDDIKEVVQDYKCTVCGAEVIMTVANVSTEKAPRHCREEMVPVWRPDSS